MSFLLISKGYESSYDFPTLVSIGEFLGCERDEVKEALDKGTEIKGFYVDQSIEGSGCKVPKIVKAKKLFEKGYAVRAVCNLTHCSYGEGKFFQDVYRRLK